LSIARQRDPHRGGSFAGTFEWSRRIQRALQRGQFVLHAQRIVDVQTGETLRHELFLRMVDRNRLIPAGEFVIEAERFGSIRAIDRWVVGKAIETAATGHIVDLNLSMRSADDELVDLIQQRLERAGADPGNLVFELSEAQLATAIETRGRFVEAVTELGCGIALDGYISGGRGSPLLRELPVDWVKLGGAYVNGVESDRGKRKAVTNATFAAHRSGQRVIAQGVESLSTLELLADLGIDEAQGNALGPPEPLESALAAA
jgi:EAL domain-containing protein (putative c-di-GMP-specific phosphodiesterase class I)